MLLTELVDQPAQLRIDVVIGEQTTVFEVHTSARDRGKIIGKAGGTASALRHILVCMAARSQIRAVLEIVD
jgi:predicted RNA-binding protein YlqC (UPF0109 family)